MKDTLLILLIISPFIIAIIGAYLYDKFYQKRCPYCKELIKKQAIKCKHCQSDLRGK